MHVLIIKLNKGLCNNYPEGGGGVWKIRGGAWEKMTTRERRAGGKN